MTTTPSFHFIKIPYVKSSSFSSCPPPPINIFLINIACDIYLFIHTYKLCIIFVCLILIINTSKSHFFKKKISFNIHCFYLLCLYATLFFINILFQFFLLFFSADTLAFIYMVPDFSNFIW